MKHNTLNYHTLEKPQKLQVIAFIRKHYSGTLLNVRKIINGDYSAIINNGNLTGVACKLDQP